MKTLYSTEEVSEMIQKGNTLMLAGDESLLRKLPKGKWIGGTIPYFMSDKGGVCTSDKVYVTEMPDYVEDVEIIFYETDTMPAIGDDYPKNGASFIIIPAATKIHETFSRDATSYKNYFNSPISGWISGVKLDDLGKITPKVFNGLTGEESEEKAVVMHVSLPPNKKAKIDIINLFKQGEGDVLSFPEAGFSVKECMVNGKKRDFSQYLSENKIDTKLPLVADYCGAMVNVSFQAVNEGSVDLYAPVFPGVQYKIAGVVDNYEKQFEVELKNHSATPIFSCNCILNYLYANLEGKQTANITGPVTFGEVAYMLLNQTMVYITFDDK